MARCLIIMTGSYPTDLDTATRRSSGTRHPSLWSTYKEKGLLSLLAGCSAKQWAMYHDKVNSLLAPCSEGSDLKVDYSLIRQLLAVQALTANKQRFCFILSLWLSKR